MNGGVLRHLFVHRRSSVLVPRVSRLHHLSSPAARALSARAAAAASLTRRTRHFSSSSVASQLWNSRFGMSDDATTSNNTAAQGKANKAKGKAKGKQKTIAKSVTSVTHTTEPVQFDGTEWQALREQSATILFASPTEVFYNPVQEVNRDISIAAIKQHARTATKRRGRKLRKSVEAKTKAAEAASGSATVAAPRLRVLEAMSATGLRSVRYARELDEHLGEIVANDLDAAAVNAIRRNVSFNNVPTSDPGNGPFITPNHGDATDVMYSSRAPEKRFDVVDLDPYGSAAFLVDSAVQSVHDGGLLLVTCTDLANLAGSQPDACFAKYGAVPVRGSYNHELALRIVLGLLSRTAARYSRVIEPMLSLSIDFYIRMFVRVHESKNLTKLALTQQSMVYQCVSCPSFALQPLGRSRTPVPKDASIESLRAANHVCRPARGPPTPQQCEHCGSAFALGGPFWNGALHDAEFARGVAAELHDNAARYGSASKSFSLVSHAAQELRDTPFMYDLTAFSRTLNLSTPPSAPIFSALFERGYRVSYCHTKAEHFKTDAPSSVLVDVMRSWAKLHPPKKPREGTPAAAILGREPAFVADFTLRPEFDALQAERAKLVENPDYWGPMSRATGAGAAAASTGAADAPVRESLHEKSRRLQNKTFSKKRAFGEGQEDSTSTTNVDGDADKNGNNNNNNNNTSATNNNSTNLDNNANEQEDKIAMQKTKEARKD